ncbi:hypothetical protein FGW37_22375 [Streptomyces rectiverticillatus]|uniref:hypothetical protein n=1 Tax=Streptomyces rectiverticillatus TaxID=173860 RepID=UPI0015C34C80|nr:hypothetical protein [Streptomyces rectiverticillatus]QLE73958.1 hypothetical protein FGW37_22375 [Streptomyces rectiverticillatus]
MGAAEQLVTVAAVILGGLTTHLTNALAERRRKRHELSTRWDDKKLDAYAGYVEKVRTSIFLAVELYELREGLRERHRDDAEIKADMSEAGHLRGRAFERIMLLGGDEVVEAAHTLNAATLGIDWQAAGTTRGTLEEWRERNRAAFRAINAFHDAARTDLGVSGRVTGEQHPERDLLLPPTCRSAE